MKKIIFAVLVFISLSATAAPAPRAQVEIENQTVQAVKEAFIVSILTSKNFNWTIKADTANSVTMTRPCGSSFFCTFNQVIMGNSSATAPEMEITTSFVKIGDKVLVIISRAILSSQMPGGQVNSMDLDTENNVRGHQDSLNIFKATFTK